MSFNRRFGFVALCVAASVCRGADAISQPVADETLRLLALQTIFPETQIVTEQGMRINLTWPEKPKPDELFFPDIFADKTVYSVVGRPANEAEKEAAEDVANGRMSRTRAVRLRLFRWPHEDGSGMLAVVQYNFLGVSPAMSSLSVGRLVHLRRNAGKWDVGDQYLLETQHHHSLQRCELLDLTGHGADDLVIESDSGGAGEYDSSLQIFDLSHGGFEELVDTASRLDYRVEVDGQDKYTQVLDIGRSRQTQGQQFCVTKTTMFENGKPFDPPRVTHPCYKRGDGIDAKDASFRKNMLAPLR